MRVTFANLRPTATPAPSCAVFRIPRFILPISPLLTTDLNPVYPRYKFILFPRPFSSSYSLISAYKTSMGASSPSQGAPWGVSSQGASSWVRLLSCKLAEICSLSLSLAEDRSSRRMRSESIQALTYFYLRRISSNPWASFCSCFRASFLNRRRIKLPPTRLPSGPDEYLRYAIQNSRSSLQYWQIFFEYCWWQKSSRAQLLLERHPWRAFSALPSVKIAHLRGMVAWMMVATARCSSGVMISVEKKPSVRPSC